MVPAAEPGRWPGFLRALIPSPAPLDRHDRSDFDGDGVPNLRDNCLLVANPDQAPAVAPAGAQPIGPDDMLVLAAAWKGEHPSARFRTDADVGEACSGYNQNYLQTTRALVEAPNETKLEIFEFLGESGPMFGGAANPFPAGRPTSFDQFGTVPGTPGDLQPSPTSGAALPQRADGSPAAGNDTPSLPMCSGYDQYAGYGRWLTASEAGGPLEGPGVLFDPGEEMFRSWYTGGEAEYGCGSDFQRPGWAAGMRHGWAGKRLYTNAGGGRITNRFFPSMTEHPASAATPSRRATCPGW